MEVSADSKVEIMLQYVHAPNQYSIHPKCAQCFMSILSHPQNKMHSDVAHTWNNVWKNPYMFNFKAPGKGSYRSMQPNPGSKDAPDTWLILSQGLLRKDPWLHPFTTALGRQDSCLFTGRKEHSSQYVNITGVKACTRCLWVVTERSSWFKRLTFCQLPILMVTASGIWFRWWQIRM